MHYWVHCCCESTAFLKQNCIGWTATTIQHPKKWVVGSKIWHLRKSVKTKFVGIKRLDWNYFMLFFDISKFLDQPLTFLDVVSLFLNCPLLIMSGVFLNNFFLITTSNLEPWSDSLVAFYDLALEKNGATWIFTSN